jgi:lysophospholipase L1-like esterase
MLESPQLTSSLWGDSGGTAVFTVVYDGTTSEGFINNVKFFNYSPGAVGAVSVADMAVGVITGSSFGANDIYQIIYWPRALSDAEVLAAYNAQKAKTAITTPRAVAFDGDSITKGEKGESVPFIIGPNLNPPANGASYAVSGSTVASLSDRAGIIDAMLAGASPQTFILSVEVGVNDLATMPGNPNGFTTALATYLDARRAAGWKTVCHTILPSPLAPPFLSDRATANATIRTWVGTHCDTLADWASDPTMGTETAPNNPTYYADGLHPTSAGYVLLEPYDRAAINGL